MAYVGLSVLVPDDVIEVVQQVFGRPLARVLAGEIAVSVAQRVESVQGAVHVPVKNNGSVVLCKVRVEPVQEPDLALRDLGLRRHVG